MIDLLTWPPHRASNWKTSQFGKFNQNAAVSGIFFVVVLFPLDGWAQWLEWMGRRWRLVMADDDLKTSVDVWWGGDDVMLNWFTSGNRMCDVTGSGRVYSWAWNKRDLLVLNICKNKIRKCGWYRCIPKRQNKVIDVSLMQTYWQTCFFFFIIQTTGNEICLCKHYKHTPLYLT